MDGCTWAASAMAAARARLDVATTNLANLSTDGFTRSLVDARLTGSGVDVRRVAAPETSALRATGRDDDLAIDGAGAFRVRDAAGRVRVTRAGAFTKERDGRMLDASGRALLGQRGALRIPVGATLDERGRVLLEGKVLDRIALPEGSRLVRGFVQSSGVDAVAEMVDVMTAERSFESAQKVVSAIDTARQKAASDVARIG